jgi:hypothetical protein
MKNIYLDSAEKLNFIKKSSQNLASNLANSCKNDFSQHNKNTELLFIWTLIFMSITGLFVLAIKSNILIMLTYLILAIVVTYAGTLAAIYYLHALKSQNKENLFLKTHNVLNKSFRLRDLFRFVRIPRFVSINSVLKSFKLAS